MRPRDRRRARRTGARLCPSHLAAAGRRRGQTGAGSGGVVASRRLMPARGDIPVRACVGWSCLCCGDIGHTRPGRRPHAAGAAGDDVERQAGQARGRHRQQRAARRDQHRIPARVHSAEGTLGCSPRTRDLASRAECAERRGLASLSAHGARPGERLHQCFQERLRPPEQSLARGAGSAGSTCRQVSPRGGVGHRHRPAEAARGGWHRLVVRDPRGRWHHRCDGGPDRVRRSIGRRLGLDHRHRAQHQGGHAGTASCTLGCRAVQPPSLVVGVDSNGHVALWRGLDRPALPRRGSRRFQPFRGAVRHEFGDRAPAVDGRGGLSLSGPRGPRGRDRESARSGRSLPRLPRGDRVRRAYGDERHDGCRRGGRRATAHDGRRCRQSRMAEDTGVRAPPSRDPPPRAQFGIRRGNHRPGRRSSGDLAPGARDRHRRRSRRPVAPVDRTLRGTVRVIPGSPDRARIPGERTMSEKYAVGVDVGGSSTKSAIYRLDGRVVGAGVHHYQPRQPSTGVAEYDADELLRAVDSSIAQAVRAATIDPAKVVAVTADSMISGTVGLAEDSSPTTAYTTTLDTRFNSVLEDMLGAHEPRIRELVGSGTPVIAAKVAGYRDTDPRAFDRTRVFVTAGGLVGRHLAGLAAAECFIDPTVLWAVGLSDTRSSSWSKELTTKLGVPASLLPRIVPWTTVVGGLSDQVAQATGLRAGTPVVAGCGDQMAGFLGAGILREHRLGDSAGTYVVVGRRVPSFEPDPAGRFDVVPSALGDGFTQQAVVAMGGGFTKQWCDDRIGGGTASLEAAAAQVGIGSDGAIFVPHFGGQSTPSRPWVRGAWLGLEWGHGKPHLARSVMEAMAFEIAIAAQSMGALTDATTEIVGYGGGARSAVASQIKADVTGLNYSSLGDIAPASLAAAMIGAIATGDLDGLDDVTAATAPLRQTFTPPPPPPPPPILLYLPYPGAPAASPPPPPRIKRPPANPTEGSRLSPSPAS